MNKNIELFNNYIKNIYLFKIFLKELLNLDIDINNSNINIYKCMFSDNIVVILKNNIYIEIIFHEFNLYYNKDNSVNENVFKIRFLEKNKFSIIDSRFYYLFVDSNNISILSTY